MDAFSLVTKLKIKKGKVYLMEYILDGSSFYKIGFTTKDTQRRASEIKKSHSLKYTSKLEVLCMYSFEVEIPNVVEKLLHLNFTEYKVKQNFECVGYSELFYVKKEILKFFESMDLISNNPNIRKERLCQGS